MGKEFAIILEGFQLKPRRHSLGCNRNEKKTTTTKQNKTKKTVINIEFQLLTMGSTLDAAGILGLPKPKTRRLEQNTCSKQSFLRVT